MNAPKGVALPSMDQLAAFHASHFATSAPQLQENFLFCGHCNEWRIIIGPYSSNCSVCGSEQVSYGEEGAAEDIEFELSAETVAMFRRGAEFRKQRAEEKAKEEEEERLAAEAEEKERSQTAAKRDAEGQAS